MRVAEENIDSYLFIYLFFEWYIRYMCAEENIEEPLKEK